MSARIDTVTLGVTDLDSARNFYERGFGFPADGNSLVELCEWDQLARDAGISPESSGFRGFTLSYIVSDSREVDDMLARLQDTDGKIVKAPKFAFWGYSGHVADPSGHFWKIASPKRKSLLGGKRNTNGGMPELVPAQELALTVGVADMKRAKGFYVDGLGTKTKKDYSKFVSFEGGDGTPDLSMYRWDALADDAGVPPEGSGFRGFAMSHKADSSDELDQHLGKATRAGAKVLRRSAESAYFADLDGYLWRISA
jgi:catechol 2,3-dioxygenase-like lactoylglutathione lyase family enzyme